MKLLWTKSTKPLSLFIRALTGNDCSHFSLVLYENSPGPLVFESNLLGTQPVFLKTSLKSHIIVHEKTIDLSQDMEDILMDAIINRYDGKPYDFSGALYLAYRTLLNRLFSRPIPLVNRWAKDESYFCNEIYSVLELAGLPHIEVAVQTPHNIYDKIKDWSCHGPA